MKEEFLNYLMANMSLAEKIGQMLIIDYRNTLEMNASLEKNKSQKKKITFFFAFE